MDVILYWEMCIIIKEKEKQPKVNYPIRKASEFLEKEREQQIPENIRSRYHQRWNKKSKQGIPQNNKEITGNQILESPL